MRVYDSEHANIDFVEVRGKQVLKLVWKTVVNDKQYRSVMKIALELITGQEIKFFAIEKSVMKVIPAEALRWTSEEFIPKASKYLRHVIIKNTQETFVMRESVLILGAYYEQGVDVMLTESQEVFESNLGMMEDVA